MMKKGTTALVSVVAVAGPAVIAGNQLTWGSSAAPPQSELPLADDNYVLAAEIDAYNDFMMSGGPPPDGIPSIDEPEFIDASSSELAPGEMVIGHVHNGEARAYPHRILVQHEIVNDQVGGQNIAITYCPLTATAQGFERGSTTLGVSGQLLNSNLVLYDRETRTYFSQINATGLRGQHRGRTLVEVDLVWTTWERWRAVHPDTKVLSERTGYLRQYARDPYGTYDPEKGPRGYYAENRTIFPLMNTSRDHHQKEMVVGARTSERSAYFVMEELARDRVQTTPSFLAVYDSELDTGHIYHASDDGVVRPAGDGGYEVDGELYRAGELPLERIVSVQAFFFAWHAFYPDSETASSAD